MKKILLTSFAIVALMSSCKKTKSIEPTALASGSNSKQVEIVVDYGGNSQICSVKWYWNPDVDSLYKNNNAKVIRYTTTSDSINIYTRSDMMGSLVSDKVTIYVNGLFKTSYTGVQAIRKIYLNK